VHPERGYLAQAFGYSDVDAADLDAAKALKHLGLLQTALLLDLYQTYEMEAVRGTYADRALRTTHARTLEPMTRAARPGAP
jgi:hypothetical protein